MPGQDKKKMKDYRQEQIVRLDIIAELYKKGYSYRDIREEVMTRLDLSSYSLRTVSKDVNRLLEEWRETRIENIDLALQLELQRIDDLIKEAWAAWDKSKTDYERKKAKQQGVPGSGEDNGEVVTVKVEQQKEEIICYGDPRYLDIIHKLLIERRKLLGLYAPEKREISGNVSFEQLLMQTGIIEDEKE
jgi:DNA-binding transcriptional MerR regulator